MDAAIRHMAALTQIREIEEKIGKREANAIFEGIEQAKRGHGVALGDQIVGMAPTTPAVMKRAKAYENAILDAILTGDRELALKLGDAAGELRRGDPDGGVECVTALHSVQKMLGEDAISKITPLLRDPNGYLEAEANMPPPLECSTARIGVLTPEQQDFQAMRSSCENDWKGGNVAEATYCCWLGHSPTVSRKHYTAPMEAEFLAISGPAGG